MRHKLWLSFLLVTLALLSCHHRLQVSDCSACLSRGGQCAIGESGAFLCLIPVEGK